MAEPACPNLHLTPPLTTRENHHMSSKTAATDPLIDADTEAVFRHAFAGAPLDSDVARRVDERAAQITEKVRRDRGVIDDEAFQSLLADDET